ncbi:Uncharacterised protein [Mycobacterium tuberculosis]|uniref:Uncharacterized protein n=1 Tax=Mycobacterium tuberculosis TaxID=1773 RepID=A0A655J1V4_MYCTX|nr:Uncharacterised protein [Mycobacterium tuberculosis]CNM35485.1 Uncharacterised protein [Mycobacterium tuberculosis]CNM45396.1 Uncharacterised protein [Mycobacterium tuberculosis]COW34944.1 Uncharacterised protein [Mycobacterium tuberculosis]
MRCGVIRSRGPPASGAITGSPDASASCTTWQNVSCSPECTKTSMLAYASASSLPYRAPVKTAVGIADCNLARSMPSPTITSRTAPEAARPVSRSTCFSGASRPTKPTMGLPSGDHRRLNTSFRADGAKRCTSTPRAHRCTRGMPWAIRDSIVAVDGARVRSARRCKWRNHAHAARAVIGMP